MVKQTLTSLDLHHLPCPSPSPSPSSVLTSVKTFVPSTIVNLGPGFDFLGCAIDRIDDHVTLRVDPNVHPREIAISNASDVSECNRNQHHPWC